MSGTQFLCFGEYLLYQSSNSYHMNSCDTIEVFYNIRTDLDKLKYASYITKIINDVTDENQNTYKILQLYLNTLYMISEEEKRFSEIELRLGLIDKDIVMMNTICERLTDSIDKIQSMNQNVISMIALQNQKLENHEKTERELKEEVKQICRCNEGIKREMQEKADHKHPTKLTKNDDSDDELYKRVSEMEKWRWTVMGAVAVAAWFIGQANIIGSLFK
jgi:DNA repair protein RecO